REWRAIRLEALQSAPGAVLSTYEETIVWADGAWRHRLANDRAVYLIARGQGRPVGMVGGALEDDGGEQTSAVVFGMFVAKTHRGQGVGRLLLRSLIDRLAAQPGIATVRLWVGEAQRPARRLYESLGFRVARRADDPERDELIMDLRVR